MRVGIFELTDGVTSERAQRLATTIDAINYPWRRIIPQLRDDPDQAVVVRWDDTPQGTTGLYYGNRIEIVLSDRDGRYAELTEPFVLAHEIGHLVDATTLDWAARQRLIDLFHASPETYRRDEQYLNGVIIEWAHIHEHSERWVAANPYLHRINEAYADAFVAAFAPTVWEGHSHRFTHATDDLDEVRRLTLERDIMVFTDVAADHTHREGIEWAAEQGLVQGYPDGTFRPEQPVTRGQLATILMREPTDRDV